VRNFVGNDVGHKDSDVLHQENRVQLYVIAFEVRRPSLCPPKVEAARWHPQTKTLLLVRALDEVRNACSSLFRQFPGKWRRGGFCAGGFERRHPLYRFLKASGCAGVAQHADER
jgi:hypothetical protein